MPVREEPRHHPHAGARRRLAAAAIAMAALLPAARCGSCSPGGGRSLILVTLDTTRADRIGAYGGRAVPTPNLDRVASEGVLFETAVSPVPLTLPSHCSILTGLYPAAHGVRHNGLYRLPGQVVTLAARLRDAGYATAAFVGAFVLNRGFGTEQGFETYDDIDVNRFTGNREEILTADRPADEVNRGVFRWLDAHRRGRFFLWVHYYDPHFPYSPPESPGRVLRGSGYDREISYVDACLGDLLDRLRKDGWLDGAVLVIVGDHGESLDEHGEQTHGALLYEGVLHVPMLVRAPGLVPAARRVRGPVSLVDVAPTALDLLGLPPLEGAQGRSLRPRIAGGSDDPGRLAFAETLMGRLEFGWSELYVARDARFKYVQAPTPELYDLERDPAESRNLAAEEAARASRMAASLRGWLSDVSKPGAAASAARDLSPDEERRLKSLGYLAGDSFKGGGSGASAETRPDPKERIQEARRLADAQARLASGDLAGGLADVEKILASNPRDFSARSARVKTLCKLERYAEAEEEAKAGISLAKADPEVPPVSMARNLELLASTYRLEKRLAEAEATYREMLRADPESEQGALDLARLLIETGRPHEALEPTARVLARDPHDGIALSTRFAAETRLGRRDEAMKTAMDLAEAQGGEPYVLMEAGDLLMKSGEVEPALKVYLAAKPYLGEDPLLLGKLGTAYLAVRQPDRARDAFTALAALSPRDPRPRFFLEQIALDRGDEKEARAQVAGALELDPRFTPPLDALGRWLARKGKNAEAREILEEAVRRNPSDGEAREALEGIPAGR